MQASSNNLKNFKTIMMYNKEFKLQPLWTHKSRISIWISTMVTINKIIR